MNNRHTFIGINQVVRLEWFDVALDMLLGGTASDVFRSELADYLKDRLQGGGFGTRGARAHAMVVSQLMKCWVTQERELIPLRDAALSIARTTSAGNRVLLHWAMMSAAYPFWYKVAHLVGRLLNLQEIVSQKQIRSRCYEAFGEKSTVERSARRLIRTFVAWGILDEMETVGCYRKHNPLRITNPELVTLLFESILAATPDRSMPLAVLQNSPSLFPFELTVVSGDRAKMLNPRIEISRFGLDDVTLSLR